jgi:hypothetical protein
MELTAVQKMLVNAYAVLKLAGRMVSIPAELVNAVDIRVAEIEIEKLTQ